MERLSTFLTLESNVVARISILCLLFYRSFLSVGSTSKVYQNNYQTTQDTGEGDNLILVEKKMFDTIYVLSMNEGYEPRLHRGGFLLELGVLPRRKRKGLQHA